MGYHHRDPTCMWYRCDSLPGPNPGDTLAMDIKNGDDFSCCSSDKIYRTLAIDQQDGDDFSCCSSDKISRLGDSRPCVFVNVGVRHRRQVGQVQGLSSHSQ